MEDDRPQCSGLVEGMRDEVSCPTCGHRADSHNDDRRCETCELLVALEG